MTHEIAMKIANKAVKDIINDLSDRRGLRQEWEQIDDDIKREIIKTWRLAVKKSIEKFN